MKCTLIWPHVRGDVTSASEPRRGPEWWQRNAKGRWFTAALMWNNARTSGMTWHSRYGQQRRVNGETEISLQPYLKDVQKWNILLYKARLHIEHTRGYGGKKEPGTYGEFSWRCIHVAIRQILDGKVILMKWRRSAKPPEKPETLNTAEVMILICLPNMFHSILIVKFYCRSRKIGR